jgi:restriction system protein
MRTGWRALIRSVDRGANRALDRALEWFAPRVSERSGCTVPVFSAGILAIVAPVLLHWIPVWYAFLEMALIPVAAFIGTAYLVQMLRQATRRHLLDWASDLRRLDADEFEWFMHELFQREGYQVTKVGSQHHGDGNIDLILERDGDRVIVQCKRWAARFVGPGDVRAFAGTFPRRGDVTGRTFVALSDFTDDARKAAELADVTLLNGRELVERFEKVRRTEPCPRCGTPMLLDRSIHGFWLRCPRFGSGCTGKRDLSPEAGRAVGLLLEQPYSA